MAVMKIASAFDRRFVVDLIILSITLLAILGRRALIESTTRLDDDSSTTKAVAYLSRFGYLEKSKAGASSLTTEALTQAITEYQEFYSLNQTGILDEETLMAMDAPRCGNPDKLRRSDHANLNFIPKRKKRAAVGDSKWRRKQLTYRLLNYPKIFINRKSEVDVTILRALNSWSEVIPFDFFKTDGQADINIAWEVKKHCETDPFDGPSGTLAHAYFPEDGRVHFDDEENWTFDGYKDNFIDLYAVAVHEFGHTLGMEHKPDKTSIMYGTYGFANKLNPDDISNAQRIYGTRDVKPENKPDKPKDRKPNLCKSAAFDAITMSKGGKVYVFMGAWYWVLNAAADSILPEFPWPILKDWRDGPTSMDAAITLKDGRFVLFKDDMYWVYTKRHLDSSYPRLISEGWPGIPSNIDGAYIGKDDRIFFFKGAQYWRFDPDDAQKVKSNFPEPISNWAGIPESINDVFRWSNGATYFFTNQLYYRYNEISREVETNAEPSFPRSTKHWWFGCDDTMNQGMVDGPENEADEPENMQFSELQVDENDFESGNSSASEIASSPLEAPKSVD